MPVVYPRHPSGIASTYFQCPKWRIFPIFSWFQSVISVSICVFVHWGKYCKEGYVSEWFRDIFFRTVSKHICPNGLEETSLPSDFGTYYSELFSNVFFWIASKHILPNGAEPDSDTEIAFNICTARIQKDDRLVLKIQIWHNIVPPWFLTQKSHQNWAANGCQMVRQLSQTVPQQHSWPLMVLLRKNASKMCPSCNTIDARTIQST